MTLAFKAMEFARRIHAQKRRRYTGNPYADHLAEVAGMVAATFEPGQPLQAMIATAWLHDSIEDVGVQVTDLCELFGAQIAFGVLALSDIEKGNRAERKAAGGMRLAAAPAWVQTIKVADLISNTSSIVEHDPKFAVTYLEEKRLLLDVLTKAHPGLLQLARDQIAVI